MIIFLSISVISAGIVSSRSVDQVYHPELLNETRRILRGNEAVDTRPYMVYLRAASEEMQTKDANWLCGGVIVHELYILTSAACIEDAKHFYVVSGTHRWIPHDENEECITNGAKRAVWKCVPKNYVYDGDELDNIRWMINDIAVVKVEDEFNFDKRVRGCDFIPKKIAYNNVTVDLEKAGTKGSIAGWGSTEAFGDIFGRSAVNSPELLETEVVVISKKNCKKRWPDRYHYIIDDSMICAKDSVDTDSISQICLEQEVKCKELIYTDEDDTYDSRRFIAYPDSLGVHTAAHVNATRRGISTGGFCENDHGGPLVVGHGPTSLVIGIISACLTANVTQKCHGPFLYTSVWKNRHLISCAIDKDKGATCMRYLRSRNSETSFNWSNHPDGPPISEQQERKKSQPELLYPKALRSAQTVIQNVTKKNRG